MISEQTYSLVKAKCKQYQEQIKIAEVRIGLHLAAVRLTDGSVGVAGTLNENKVHCSKAQRDFGDYTPTQITGRTVADLFETDKKSGVIDTLRIAVLHALSSRLIADAGYKIVEDADPVDLIDLQPQKTITIVGAFQSYIQKISNTDNILHVLELDENALTAEHKKFYVPAEKFPEILPVSDIVIITGLSLVNRTIDDLLASTRPGAKVVVTGPSGNILPDILFENNVDIIGAMRITDEKLLFDLVSEAGTGYHMFRYCAKKICILNEK
jgi:uncharacterized protein